MAAEQEQTLGPSNLPMIAVSVLTVASLALVWFGQEESRKRIAKLPIEGVIAEQAAAPPATTYSPAQIALIIGKAPTEDQNPSSARNPADLDDVFSPALVADRIEAVAAEVILPPVIEVVDAPPPENLTRIFKDTFLLDGLATAGAFFNQRFFAVGSVIFEGRPPGFQSEMKAILVAADPKGVSVRVNDEVIRIDYVPPGNEYSPIG